MGVIVIRSGQAQRVVFRENRSRILVGGAAVTAINIRRGIEARDGRPVELRINSTHIQWQHQGDTDWTDLVALSDIHATVNKVEIKTTGTEGNFLDIPELDGKEILLYIRAGEPLDEVTGNPEQGEFKRAAGGTRVTFKYDVDGVEKHKILYK